MNLTLKIPPPLVMLIFGAVMYAFAQAFSVMPFMVSAALVVVTVACGLAVMVSAVLSFRRAQTTVNPLKPEEASALVVAGVFRYTRNPMYLGMVILLIAWSLWLGELLVLLFVGLFMWYLQTFQIKPEEQHLKALFGEPYSQYLSDTRRWL